MKKVISRIYIGPNLTRGRLVRFSVFIGGLPKNLENEFSVCPELVRLFVLTEQLTEALQEVNTAGTPLNKYYNLALEV